MKQKYSTHRKKTVRRGSILIEAIVAAIILGAAISMLVPAMTAVGHQRQSHRFESLAVVELNNIAEFLPSATEMAEAQPGKLALSEWFQNRYANAHLDTELLPKSTDVAAENLQAIRLTIRRPAYEKMPEQQVSIVIWQPIEEPAP